MRILYLMHVDWNWIKQRPHFIAEKLAENGIEAEVYYQKNFDKKLLTSNAKGNFLIKEIPRLPMSRFSVIRKINTFIYECFLENLLSKKDYDYVYLTHPVFFSTKINVPIIYDCMDDVLEFSSNLKENKKLFVLEKQVIQHSKYVFFTSEYLKNALLKRYNLGNISGKFSVNNNAIELPKTNILENIKLTESNRIKFVYIGTISEWFDFNLLETLDKEKYEFHLFGPVDNISTNREENFIFHGPVSRDKIFSIMNAADILIMPFIVNKLIESVNPVKLYEYIFSCKPIISVEYGETLKFSDYVYLYKNGNVKSFEDCVRKIESNEMRSKACENDCKNFAENNTWNNRALEIKRKISELDIHKNLSECLDGNCCEKLWEKVN
ncbi:MAG: glycosyltransferase [Bacteroides sp.]|nr:glycosyltransferase [Prevotella sp.]MCM1407372.1 glycosyltransferase [Treponema brennaborense]MCM1469862.1 glycosyltransferase [Bacteroides sp.]